MGRKKVGGTVAIVIIVAVIAIVALGMFGGVFSGTGITIPGTGTPSAASANCPDDGITTVSAKVQDIYAATTTYVTGTGSSNDQTGNLVYFDVTTGTIIGQKNSSATSWTTQDMDCANTARVYALSDTQNVASAMTEDFLLTGNNLYQVLETNQLSKMTVKVKDLDGDDWEFLFANGATTGTNVSTGVDLNKTNVYDTTAAGDIAVGADGFIDMLIQLKSATARKYGNDIGKPHYACIEVGTDNEWDKDSIRMTVDGGSALPDVKSQIDEDSKEQSTIQNAEACYDIGDIDDTYTDITFYIKAKSGQNPDTSNDDVTIYFYGESLYDSSDEPDTIKQGVWSDASTQLLALWGGTTTTSDGEDPYIIFNIS